MKRNVARDELDAYWVQTIRKAIAHGDYTTAYWCAGVRAQAEDETLIPALLIRAEHAHSSSEDILISFVSCNGDSSDAGDMITMTVAAAAIARPV